MNARVNIEGLGKTTHDEMYFSSGMFSSQVSHVDGENILLKDGITAKQAFSCLIEVLVDDVVSVCKLMDGQHYVIAVLSRQDKSQQTIQTPGVKQLSITADSIRILGKTRVQTIAGQTLSMICVGGRIATHAKELIQHAACNLISKARNHFNHAEHYAVKAQDLVSIQGQHNLIEAQKEMRLNAEHINMG
ncbi:DUF3540 domain-containing protein [Teredinibacter sp. KSP-S5-2]|uniref:DUF3540 domain-containing protein n=1 Tax=Teredinibacter sp. KSP-S5-2 TaxID=3034506 RepID=UPI002934DE2D|nr:DUF3540 domain-containing protein [Teredinibacter sp. KSP-S5-2]WNO11631.1 DUF3540 domain-containing protein [Teredinibacter sp. KSP-S5-2]